PPAILLPVLLTFLYAEAPPLAPQPENVRLAELALRRQRIMKKIGPNSVLILFAAEPHVYAADTDQPYREENNFYYLTGVQQTGAILALVPGAAGHRELLFLPTKTRSREIFTGKVITSPEAQRLSGISDIFRTSDLRAVLGLPALPPALSETTPEKAELDLLQKEYKPLQDAVKAERAQLYLFLPRERESVEYRHEQVLAAAVAQVSSGITVHDASTVLRELRLIKSPREIELIQHAIDITAEGFERAIAAAAPGRCECDLQAEFDFTFTRRGAHFGYPTIVGSGINGTTLHYNENRGRLQSGDLVVVDAGAEYEQYSADVTRTIAVDGKFTKNQAEIYRIVYDAQQASIAAALPGAATWRDRGIDVIKNRLLALGLITNKDNDEYRIWLPHGTGHHLGMNVHDLEKPGIELAPGMVVTIEPGLYIRPDALDALPKTPENTKFIAAVKPAFEKYKGIAVRIEDDLLITSGSPKVLSAAIPSKP
ncbi:MAG: aminopeptidase Metallo peptidase, partial [Bryobacterales bacterium]|nr:aminopeptidase Metallo peptidase [Bryobacterales bacterium]